ncbi:MAG: hypothetical protein JNK82_24980 [Myxococcaceae bacterium]|nr:hypothetical protein [Myxococcaceae bacterium]
MLLAALVLLAVGDVDVDVDQLSTDELIVEETRLSHPESLTTPGVMMGLGFAIGAAGFGAMAVNLQAPPPTFSLAWVGPIIAVLGGITGVLGSSLMLTGMLLTPYRRVDREEGTIRLAQVRERLAMTGRMPVDEEGVRRRQMAILEAAKPSSGPATAFIVGGVLAIIAGVISVAFVNNPPQLASAGVGELGVGSATLGVGIWQLIVREQEREAIDAERRELLGRLRSDWR